MLRALSLLILCALGLPALGALPELPEHGPALRIQGSNTIGAELGPALVKGLLHAQGLHEIHSQSTGRDNEQRIVGKTADGRRVVVEVAAHGSGTGFTALKAGLADLAAASRPIKDSERAALHNLGDLKSPAAEQIIAIDGLAIIVHPGNPLDRLNTEQLARIFAGDIRTWEELGGIGGPIHVYARDDQSGTYDTFKDLVLADRSKTLTSQARRFESSERLSDEVSADPQGIGFIGLPYVRRGKAMAIVDGASAPMLPVNSLIATEDYPLSRRLFFYLPQTPRNPWAEQLVRFAQSAEGQAIVAHSGFMAQTVQAVSIPASPQMPEAYRTLARQAQRLTVNFRFEEGSANLDNKAREDLPRVLDYLRQHAKLDRRVTLVGFGDAKSDPQRAALLSKLRAMALRRALIKGGVVLRDIQAAGAQMPVAANNLDEGRFRNRRVEVWVH